jgi:non-ribosomal peptide synthetase component E (peptide arylation enzyme)
MMSSGGLDTVNSPAFTDEESARYRAVGWWSDATLSDAVRHNADYSPDRCAFADDPGAALTWREFDCSADALAEQLAGVGVQGGDRVAVWHGESTAIHVLFVAIERCGAVVIGVGARAGTREVAAILRTSQPKLLISDQQRSEAATGVVAEFPIPALVLAHDADVPRLDIDAKPKAVRVESQLGPDDVFLINSTSGTTGLPKCVVHTQNLPYRPAAEFEELTGAKILQFYGSNETGLLSGTTLRDPIERRLRTGGRVVPEMAVRLFDGDEDVTTTGRGQPACRGPATSLGYLDGTDHDQLFTRDGWMRMGDICEIDADGYLTVTGRTSDFILRGGKNISAAQVEDAAMTHPAIAIAAAVAMPDPVFGEKVCLYVELTDSQRIDLPELVEYLLAQGVSKELLPERLIVVDELPRSSGAKIAKSRLREDIRARMEANHERT